MKIVVPEGSADTDIEEAYIKFKNREERKLFAQHLLSSDPENETYYIGPIGYDPESVKLKMSKIT